HAPSSRPPGSHRRVATRRIGAMAVKGRDHCHPPATIATTRQGWVPRPVGVRNCRSGGVCVGMYVCICHLVTSTNTHTRAPCYISPPVQRYISPLSPICICSAG